MSLRFGLEEEFMTLDPQTLRPVNLGRRFVDVLRRGRHAEHAKVELLSSQLEYTSPIFADFGQAERGVLAFRRALGCLAESDDVVVAGSGTPFTPALPAVFNHGDRYDRVNADAGPLAEDHQINGLHVHIEVTDPELAVQVLNRVRYWLPVLLALSGNSPFWQGRNTGYASWRTIQNLRWTTSGCPPSFASATDYFAQTRALTGLGLTSDQGTISWYLRLSHRYPTLEFRVADAQLSAESSIFLAALCRALVQTAVVAPNDIKAASLSDSVLNASLWHAAKHGLSSMLLDPISGVRAPASNVVLNLLDRLRPALGDDWTVTRDSGNRALFEGNGAQLQARQFKQYGLKGLGELFQRTLGAESSMKGNGR